METGVIKDKREVLERLLKFGIFAEKMPPCFNSEEYGEYIYNKIASGSYVSPNSYKVYKYITYPLTQENKIRLLSIPNFIGYTELCLSLYNNWEHLLKYFETNWSKGNPHAIRMQKKKKRIFKVWDYDEVVEEIVTYRNTRLVKLGNIKKNIYSEQLDKLINKKYVLHLDISKFYPTVYSHSISWALIDKEVSKVHYKNDRERKAYIASTGFNYSDIEDKVMNMQDRESFGLPVGPDVSYIIADILLSKIDKELQERFTYIRYIDDFHFYAKDENEAIEFENLLRQCLYKYKLQLNDKKKELTKLPICLEDEWVHELRGFTLPLNITSNNHINTLVEYLDLCTKHSKNFNARVIKYGMSILINTYSLKNLSKQAISIISKYLFHMIFIYPYLIDLLPRFLAKMKPNTFDVLISFLNILLIDAFNSSKYDVLSWILYIATKYKLVINIDSLYFNNEIRLKDCSSLTLLFYYMKDVLVEKKKIYKSVVEKDFKSFYNDKIKDKMNEEFWLLEYELYFNKIMGLTGEKAKIYRELRSHGISFINV